jgi:glycosyltransferase involved in cell wall biosynthesis
LKDGLRVVYAAPEPDALGRSPDALFEAWFSLRDVTRAVAAAGAEVTAVLAAVYDATVVREGVTYDFVRVPLRTGLRSRLGRWATRLDHRWIARVRAARPDVIHFNGLGFPRHIKALAKALPDVPILVQDHADGLPGPWTRGLHARGLARAAGVAFTAADQALPFVGAGLLGQVAQIFEIPESSSDFTPGDPLGARRETGLYGDPCLLWLGNLDENKDPMTVLAAVARAAERLPDLQLWCAFRHQTLLAEVRARLAEDPALSERIHLIGAQRRDRVETLLRAADFLVQGSHREGSGYAVIEALACGVTPLITNIPSFRALTGEGAVGGLFEPGDDLALADLLVCFAARDRDDLRDRARRHFDAHLSFEIVGRSLVDAYRALVARPD